MIEVQLEGWIYELNFGYNAKMEVYAKSSLDISKLCERRCHQFIGGETYVKENC